MRQSRRIFLIASILSLIAISGASSSHAMSNILRVFFGQSSTPPFTPLSLPSLWSWWDASQETVVADDTIVTGMVDRSGNGRHLVDPSGFHAFFKGPKYRTNVFGTKSALQGWKTGSDISWLQVNATIPTDASLYMVIKTSTAASQFGLFGSSAGGDDPFNTSPYISIQDNSGTYRTLDSATYRNIGALADNTKYIIRVLWSGTANTQKVYVNGVLFLDAIIADAGSKSWLQLFTAYNGIFRGHIADFVISSVIDTAGNQSRVENYFNSKWNVY